MTNLKPVDVAIIGGGWTGLLMAKEITAKTSQSVAVFERGIPRKIEDYAVTMDELDYSKIKRRHIEWYLLSPKLPAASEGRVTVRAVIEAVKCGEGPIGAAGKRTTAGRTRRSSIGSERV